MVHIMSAYIADRQPNNGEAIHIFWIACIFELIGTIWLSNPHESFRVYTAFILKTGCFPEWGLEVQADFCSRGIRPVIFCVYQVIGSR